MQNIVSVDVYRPEGLPEYYSEIVFVAYADGTDEALFPASGEVRIDYQKLVGMTRGEAISFRTRKLVDFATS